MYCVALPSWPTGAATACPSVVLQYVMRSIEPVRGGAGSGVGVEPGCGMLRSVLSAAGVQPPARTVVRSRSPAGLRSRPSAAVIGVASGATLASGSA